jgi:hypothetical protein
MHSPLASIEATFTRDGVEYNRWISRNGSRALQMTLLILSELQELQDGDVLQVKAVDQAEWQPFDPLTLGGEL